MSNEHDASGFLNVYQYAIGLQADDSLSDARKAKLATWYEMAVPAQLREAVAAGEITVEIDAYASATGSPEAGRALAQERAAQVQRMMREVAGDQARIQTSAHGEEGGRDEVVIKIRRS